MSEATDGTVAELVAHWAQQPLEEPACDWCGATERRVLEWEVYALHTFRGVRCRRCGLVYTCPRPTPQMREQLHTPAIRNALVEAGVLAARHRIPEGVATVYAWEHQEARRPNYERALAALRRAGSSGRLLDVGCAGGMFVKLAQEAGFEAVGCDIMPQQVKYGVEELGLDLRVGLPGDLFGEGEFDVVTLWDVIEHVPSPGALVDQLARVLKPGGHLLLQTLNYALHQAQCQLGLRGNPSEYHHVYHEHLHYFTRRTLDRYLRRSGLGGVRYLHVTDDCNRRRAAALRRAAMRGLCAATGGLVDFYTPLFALATRER